MTTSQFAIDASRVCDPAGDDKNEQFAVEIQRSQVPPPPVESPQSLERRFSLRERRPPKYLQDYDTEIRFCVPKFDI